MLQLQTIRESKDEVIRRLAKKHFDGPKFINEIARIDSERRKTLTELETIKAEANALAKQIGELMKSGKKAEADDIKNKSVALKDSEKKLQEVLAAFEEEQ
jgi:seryl-tRNA synthetase